MELAAAIALAVAVALGVAGVLGGAFAGGRRADTELDAQLFMSSVLAQVETVPYDTLLSLNGTYVQNGDLRADLTAVLEDTGLIKVQVDVSSAVDPDLSFTTVVLRADTE